MTRDEKIIIIAQYFTNDQEEIKRIIKEIDKEWFDVQINSAIYNLLDNEGGGVIC